MIFVWIAAQISMPPWFLDWLPPLNCTHLIETSLILKPILPESILKWLASLLQLTLPKSNLHTLNNHPSLKSHTSPLFFIFYYFLLHIGLIFSKSTLFLQSQWIQLRQSWLYHKQTFSTKYDNSIIENEIYRLDGNLSRNENMFLHITAI